MNKKEVDLAEPEQEIENEKIQKFRVFNPLKINGHVKYTITGVDDQGVFEEKRRFKEFFALRNTLL